MWSTVQGGSGQWGQTAARRVGICSSQVRSQVQLLSWQGGGARTPQHQCLDEINFFKKSAHNQNPILLSLPWYGHLEMPNGHSQQIFTQMIFAQWNCARSLQVQIGQRGGPFQKTVTIDWTAVATQKVSVQAGSYAPRNLRLTDHLEAGLFPLSHGSALLELQTAQKPTRNPTALGYLGCAKAPLGARVGSRCVGHKVRQSFCCQCSWVWGPDTL